MFLAVAANLLPAGLLFYFVHRFGIDLPTWDEWQLMIPLQKFYDGTLGYTVMFAEHNEHRMPFPRLLTLANGLLFHWDRKVEMYATVVLLILCAWLYYRFARQYWAHPLTPLLFVPVAFTLLSWRQSENLLMGMGTVFSLLVTGTVLAFFLLHRARGNDKFVWGAAAAAFVASFSSAGGLFLWPIGVAQLALQRWAGGPDEKPGRGAFVVWGSAGALTCTLFFVGYYLKPVPWPAGIAYVMHHPLAALGYMAGMIGGPLSDRLPIAQSLGAVVAALSVWTVLRMRRAPRELAAAAPLLAFMAFTLLVVVSACDRRLGMGVGEALTPRYCSMTMLSLAALYALLTRFALAERGRGIRLAWAGVAALMMAAALVGYAPWRHDPAGRVEWYALREYAMRNADVVGDGTVALLFPNADVVRQRAHFLRAHGFTAFQRAVADALPARSIDGGETCAIDAVSGKSGPLVEVARHRESAGVRVTGRAVDAATGQEASRVYVTIDGRIYIPALMEHGDFTSYMRTALLTDGEHDLALKIVSHDGLSYSTCGTMRIRIGE